MDRLTSPQEDREEKAGLMYRWAWFGLAVIVVGLAFYGWREDSRNDCAYAKRVVEALMKQGR